MTYLEKSKEKLNSLRNRNDYLILAFESSCDETAVAVTRGREVLSSVISSQIEIHKRFGGVVPEIASRNHALAIDSITKEALEKAGVTFDDIDAIAVTYGAGLLGALLVGVSYAKALAYTLEKPLIEPPFICLLASGGNIYILKVNTFDDMEVMGETQDDAVGEAFDKVARVLGLPYPGGPEIDKLARLGKPSYKLPRAFKGEKHLNFSYSGLKTAVINLVANTKARGGEIIPEDLACSFQTEATGVLIENTIEAARRSNISTICLAGGVGANSALRDGLTKAGQKAHCKVLLPPRSLCTDNAAMIGICAYEEIKCGIEPAELSLDANPGL